MGAQAVRLSNVDIDNALKNKDFEVLFQPVFDLGNGALARVESFVRWRHPALGVLPPGAFISFFESQGRMSELTRYVLAESLKTYMDWRGASAPGFSINLALSDLTDEAFASHFQKVMRDMEFPADLVTLECPMPAVDTDLDDAAAQFARLAGTGARLAIEVRGRANDLLRNIDPFPFDEIKTGGSSILRFARTVRGPGLSAISDLLEIANQANAVITAVGVEDQASLGALRGLGFTAAQGNHLNKVGKLSDFLPSRVNEVRGLLGLDPLSAESLAALFRTGAPEVKPAELETLEVVEEPKTDAMIERLNERVAQQTASSEPSEEEKRKSKAREKAKALALAKRAKAREARKSAAIARAKAKAAQIAEDNAETPQSQSDLFPPVAAPHALQERLSREFASEASEQQSAPAASNAPESEEPHMKEPIAKRQQSAPETEAQETEKLSVPEKLAAAQGQAAAESNAAPSVEATDMQEIGLAVGEARAYFQHGISVGGPVFDPKIHNSATRAAAELAQAQEQNENEAASAMSPQDMLAASAQSAEQTQPPSQENVEEQKSALIDQGDLHAEYGVEAAQPKKPKTKNFLSRKYRVIPTHFWPKPWKRAYLRWAANRAANDDTENTDTTVQAAE